LVYFCGESKISFCDTASIMGRQADLHRAVHIIPIRVMVLLLSAFRNKIHELPRTLKIAELEISGQPTVLKPPSWVVLKKR
jgi:hypothetical protein